MISISFLGRLVEDPQQRAQGNYKLTSFRVAARTDRKDSENKPITNFFNASCFGALGDTITKYFHQGDLIYIHGKLCLRSYQGNDGTAKVSNDVNIVDFDFIPKGSGSGSGNGGGNTYNQNAPQSRAPKFTPVESDNDLPF